MSNPLPADQRGWRSFALNLIVAIGVGLLLGASEIETMIVFMLLSIETRLHYS